MDMKIERILKNNLTKNDYEEYGCGGTQHFSVYTDVTEVLLELIKTATDYVYIEHESHPQSGYDYWTIITNTPSWVCVNQGEEYINILRGDMK